MFIDLHEDLVNYFNKNIGFLKMQRSDFTIPDLQNRHADLPSYQAAGTKVIMCSMFPLTYSNGEWRSIHPKREIADQIRAYKKIANTYSNFYIIKNAADLKKNFRKKNKIGMLLHMEGAEAITHTSDIGKYYQMGIRSIGLTWDHKNHIAGGLQSNTGLSLFGIKVIQEMKKYNFLLDLVHVNQKSFNQAQTVWNRPFMVSHSAIKELSNHKQNMTNEQLRIIRRSKGLFGIGMLRAFYGARPTVETIVDHFQYLKKEFGTDFCGIGTDFFGFSLDDCPKGFSNMSGLRTLRKQLQIRGWSTNELSNVYWKNAYSFLTKNL